MSLSEEQLKKWEAEADESIENYLSDSENRLSIRIGALIGEVRRQRSERARSAVYTCELQEAIRAKDEKIKEAIQWCEENWDGKNEKFFSLREALDSALAESKK